MRRILGILIMTLGFTLGPAVVPAHAWSRPCVSAQVNTIWVQQCSPIVFNTSSCWSYTYTGGSNGQYAQVIVCYPTS